MQRWKLRNPVVLMAVLMAGVMGGGVLLWGDEFPQVGDAAENFTLKDVGGDEVELKSLTREGPVVLLFLRGYPGYQCPLCTKQVADFSNKAQEFAGEKARILLIYPGEAADLKKRAEEFLGAKKLPENILFVTDPDYEVTNLWKLRWDAPKETAYPSTFVIDTAGKIQFAKVSKSHGGRTKGAEILEVVQKMAAP